MRKTLLIALALAGLATASYAAPITTIVDTDNNAVGVTSNALNVNVSAAALPTGAATAAKQPAPGTAGTPSADVITVQGVSGGTGLNVTSTGNVASAATDSGNPVKVGCIYNSTLPTFTDGQRANCGSDSRGNIGVIVKFSSATGVDAVSNTSVISGSATTVANASGGTNPLLTAGYIYNGTTWDRRRGILGAVSSAGVGVVAVEETGRPFSHISTNTTTTIKSGAGFLHSLVINTRGLTNTATIYDNTAGSGTVVAAIDTTLSTTAFVYDIAFSTGLTIVTAGGTAADLTISYR